MVTGAFSVDVTFIGSVTGFGNADISVQNATKRGFSGSGASYSVTITPTTAGVVRVWVPGLAGLTSDDFQSKPSRVFEVLYNTAATVNGPSVASFVASDPVGGLFTATLMYDDGVTGICLDSFEVTGGTVTGFEALNDHPSFSVDHTYYTVVEGRVINETSYGSVRDAVLAGANEHSLLRVTTEYRSGYRVTITPDAAGGTVTINVPAGAGVDRDGRRSQAATLTHTVAQILTDDAVEVTAVRSEVALGERALFRLARVSGTGTPTVNVRVSAPAGVLPDITAPTTTIKVTFADGERLRIVTLDTSPDATITSSDNELTLRIRPGTGYTADPNATTATATLLGPEDRGVVVRPGTLRIIETHSDTYTVALASEPTASVTVAISSDDTNVATVSPASLTFTTTNWRTAQPVTVTAADDTDALKGAATVSHMVSGGNYEGVQAASVSIIVTDDDVVLLDPTEATVAAGGTGTYSVVLAVEPINDVTISVASGDTAVASVDKASLVFTMLNWDTAQTVTVTGVAAGAATIGHTVSGVDYGSTSVSGPDLAITVAERAVQIDPEAVTLDPGTTDTYTVVLATAPTGDVTITVTSGAPSVATVDEASLTFTTTDWATAQTVTVTGAAPGTTTITHAVSGGDYGSVSAPGVVVGVRGVVVAPEAVTLDPNTTDTYTVVLATAPTGSVTISVTSGDAGVASVDEASLTFTTTDWATAQTVTVTGEAPGTTTITHAVSGADYGANNVTAPDVVVGVRGVVVDPDALDVVVDAARTYTVALAAAPTGDVTISVASDDTTVATVEPGVLVFTMSNWATAQTVTVTGAAAGATSVSHTVSGADYASVSAPGVDVTVAARGVVVTPEAVTLDPGTTDTYTVVLATAPTGDVTITVATDDGDRVWRRWTRRRWCSRPRIGRRRRR